MGNDETKVKDTLTLMVDTILRVASNENVDITAGFCTTKPEVSGGNDMTEWNASSPTVAAHDLDGEL